MPQDWWEPQEWSETQAWNVARQVFALRGKRSAQWLSDETERIGYRVKRATIADLENGRRRYVTVAEVAVLAAALNTAPIALLYGPDYNAESDVLPDVRRRKIDGAQWFSGLLGSGFTDRVSLPGESAGAGGAESARLRAEYRDNVRELQSWREYFDVDKKIFGVVIPANATDETRKAIEARLDDLLSQRQELRTRLGLKDDNDGG
jgi:hypothetical protein